MPDFFYSTNQILTHFWKKTTGIIYLKVSSVQRDKSLIWLNSVRLKIWTCFFRERWQD